MTVSQTVVRAPTHVLRPYVTRYVGYRLLGHQPALHRGLPSRSMTLMFSIDRAIDVVAQTDPRLPPRSYRAMLAGLHDSPALIRHDGNQEGVSIQLSPVGSRALLGLPAAALWDLTLEAEEVTGRAAVELSERLHDSDDWDKRFAVCDQVLTGLLGEHTLAPELTRVWDALVQTGGRVTVAELAEDVGYSRQHLRHRFTREFGLGPKRAARLIRFNQAAGDLTASSSPDFATVAVSCGYYDQAHMHREFASLAGCTPAELVAGDLPNVQDEAVPNHR